MEYMRKAAFLVLAFLCALTAGVQSSNVWSRIQPAIPYCRVAKNAEWYHGRYIRVRSRLVFGTSGTYVFESCDPVEALASLVEMQAQPNSSAPGYVDEVLVTGEKPQVQTADAIIEGVFDAHSSTGCWAPKFHIQATNIQLMSEVRPYSLPDDSDDGLRNKH